MKKIKIDVCWEITDKNSKMAGVQMFAGKCPIALELQKAREDSPEPSCFEYYWDPDRHTEQGSQTCVFYMGHSVDEMTVICSCPDKK